MKKKIKIPFEILMPNFNMLHQTPGYKITFRYEVSDAVF